MATYTGTNINAATNYASLVKSTGTNVNFSTNYSFITGPAPIRMRGFDSGLGVEVYWYSATTDSTGQFYNGIGPLSDITQVK